MKISLLPIDVGFDIRALGTQVDLADTVKSVTIKHKQGQTVEITGSVDEIRQQLHHHGFETV